MSFPRYPKYKASEVEWLGEVPVHWEVTPVRHLLLRIEQGWSPECLSRPAETDEWGVLKSGCTNRGVFADGENKALPAELEPLPELEVRAGDLLMSRASGSPSLVGSTALVRETKPRLMLSDKVFRLHPTSSCSATFLAWVLGSAFLRAQIVCAISGADGLANNLPQGDLRGFLCPCPPPHEQLMAAAFLDRETAKIDALVAEQQRLVELLKEKRQAVISHAVTKGLNPDAPMKPSGVEWLGDVPAHWRCVPIKRTARAGTKTFVDGDWIEAPYITDAGVRLLQCGNVGTGVFEEQGYRYIGEDTFRALGCTEVCHSDVLICRLQSSRTIRAGRACVAPQLGVRMITSVDNCILKLSSDFASRYIVYQLSTPEWLSFVEVVARGGTRDRISRSILGDMKLAAPPVREQQEIVEHLQRETTVLDALTAEAERAITLLQERRTALISAAVTGQIDVRGFRPGVDAP